MNYSYKNPMSPYCVSSIELTTASQRALQNTASKLEKQIKMIILKKCIPGSLSCHGDNVKMTINIKFNKSVPFPDITAESHAY